MKVFSQRRSIHFDHTRVEVRVLVSFARVEADAAHCDDIDEADQHCCQTSKTCQSSLSTHKVIECVVAVSQLLVAICIIKKLPLVLHSLMLLNLKKQLGAIGSDSKPDSIEHHPPQPKSFSSAAKTQTYYVLAVQFGQSEYFKQFPVKLRPKAGLLKRVQSQLVLSTPHPQSLQNESYASQLVLQISSMKVVLAPFLQLLPKINSGPTKKKMVIPKKKIKNTKIPIEQRASKHVPLLYLFFEDLIEPANPATPSNKKMIEDIQRAISEALTAPLLAELIISFFSTCTQMVAE